jgi:DNA-binding beta-propeller fold protein YncE
MIQKFNLNEGYWTVVATDGSDLGQMNSPLGLVADGEGNLYIAEYNNEIQKRDADGNWTTLAVGGPDVGQVNLPSGIAVDGLGNFYVADTGNSRIQMRDSEGNWVILASPGGYVSSPGSVFNPTGVAADQVGNLFVSEGNDRIQKRDTQGNWIVLADSGYNLGSVRFPQGVAVDGDGNLYVADRGYPTGRIQKRFADGLTPPLVPADIDGDGIVTVADVTHLLRAFVGLDAPLTPQQLQIMDVRPKNSDGTYGDEQITMADLNWALRRALGLETTP